MDRSVFRFDDKYGHLADGECLDPASALADEVALKLDPESMRYAIAEALLRDELASIDPSTISRAPPVPIPVVFGTDPSEEAKSGGTGRQQKTSDEERASDLAKIIMYKFGDCTVRVNPMASQAMAQAAPDTAAEGAAIQLLMPALGSCLEKGTQVTLNRTRLRGAVALSYYSLAHASAAQKGSSASPQH